jgi:hypothetical protein
MKSLATLIFAFCFTAFGQLSTSSAGAPQSKKVTTRTTAKNVGRSPRVAFLADSSARSERLPQDRVVTIFFGPNRVKYKDMPEPADKPHLVLVPEAKSSNPEPRHVAVKYYSLKKVGEEWKLTWLDLDEDHKIGKDEPVAHTQVKGALIKNVADVIAFAKRNGHTRMAHLAVLNDLGWEAGRDIPASVVVSPSNGVPASNGIPTGSVTVSLTNTALPGNGNLDVIYFDAATSTVIASQTIHINPNPGYVTVAIPAIVTDSVRSVMVLARDDEGGGSITSYFSVVSPESGIGIP